MQEAHCNPEDGRVRSGKARMAKLTPEERRELARKAAKSRWLSIPHREVRQATHMGEIELANGQVSIPCAVLEDGTRVLTQAGFLTAIGRRGGPKDTFRETGGSLDKVPPFLSAENLQPYISGELRQAAGPIPFRLPAGQNAWGYPAELLPQVCEVYLKARESKVHVRSQEATIAACEVLVRGLAQVGIIALIDEATGYQNSRAADALARILEAFIAKELQPWIRTFPPEFYRELFRLRDLEFPDGTVKRPQYFGVLTNDIVYARLAPGVLSELKKGVPRNEDGRPTAKYFQKLTSNIGYPKLREHLGAVLAVMRLSKDYHEFIGTLNLYYPRYGQQTLLPLYESESDPGTGI